MGASKTDRFTASQNQIATIAKALGHPARIAILEQLLKANTRIGEDIVNKLPLSQPTISQHLEILRNAALIHGTIEGNAISYCINSNTLEIFNRYLAQIIAAVNRQNSH